MRYWRTSGESFPLTRERSIGSVVVPVAIVFLPVVVLLNRRGWAVTGTHFSSCRNLHSLSNLIQSATKSLKFVGRSRAMRRSLTCSRSPFQNHIT